MNEPALNLKTSVPQRLDLLLAADSSRDAFLREVAALCALSPESPWETLALVDQYYRRGKLSNDLFIAAKTRIERRVLGLQDPVAFVDRDAAVPLPADQFAEPIAPSLVETAPASAAPVIAAPVVAASVPPTASSAAPAAAVVVDAPSRAEMRALHSELARVRKQASVYFERLEHEEWRRRAAETPDAPDARDARDAPDAPAIAAARAGHIHPQFRERSTVRWAMGAAALAALVAALLLLASRNEPDAAIRIARQARLAAAHAPRAPVTVPRPPGQLQFDDDRAIAFPGDRVAVLTVRRTGGTGGQVGFDWWTVGLGARAGQDFVAHGHQSLFLADGQDSAQLRIPILSNAARRHTEMLAVHIGSPQGGATLGAVAQATIFIMPADRKPHGRRP